MNRFFLRACLRGALLLSVSGTVLASFRDVTESRRLESELIQTKEFLESLIQASPDGIHCSDQ